MGMLDAGALNQKVTLQTATRTSDGQGGQDATWSTLAKVWAEVLPIRGLETLGGTEVTGALVTSLSIRYRTDLSVKDRVVLGDRTLEIQSLSDPNGQREALTLSCIEVVA